MPQKKGKGKGKKTKNDEGKSAAARGPPGQRPGGIPLQISTLDNKTYDVSELRGASVASLKKRIGEVTGLAAAQLHLFVESSQGLEVRQLKGYTASWLWPPERRLLGMHDEFSLDLYHLSPAATVFMLVKMAALRQDDCFVRTEAERVAIAERSVRQLLQSAPARARPLQNTMLVPSPVS